MVNLKRWMAKVGKKLTSLRGLAVVADDYYGANTSGQAHSYTLESTSCYLLFCGKINGVGSGVYFVTANTGTTMVGALINSSVVTVTPNGLTLSVKIDANYMRVSLIKVGGVISYLLHLTESLKSFVGRRWAYAESQESADENPCRNSLVKDEDHKFCLCEQLYTKRHRHIGKRDVHEYRGKHCLGSPSRLHTVSCDVRSDRSKRCCRLPLQIRFGIKQNSGTTASQFSLNCDASISNNCSIEHKSVVPSAPERGWWCA